MKRTNRGQDADPGLVEPEGRHIGEGELAEVTKPFRDQEQHNRPAHEPANGINETIESAGEHEAGNSEERCSRHVVARDGEAVLEPCDTAASRVEVGCGLGPCGSAIGYDQRHKDETHEHTDCGPVCGLLFNCALNGSRKGWERRAKTRAQREAQPRDAFCGNHFVTSLMSSRVISSKRLFATHT